MYNGPQNHILTIKAPTLKGGSSVNRCSDLRVLLYGNLLTATAARSSALQPRASTDVRWTTAVAQDGGFGQRPSLWWGVLTLCWHFLARCRPWYKGPNRASKSRDSLAEVELVT